MGLAIKNISGTKLWIKATIGGLGYKKLTRHLQKTAERDPKVLVYAWYQLVSIIRKNAPDQMENLNKIRDTIDNNISEELFIFGREIKMQCHSNTNLNAKNNHILNATIMFFSPAKNGRAVMPIGDGYSPYLTIGNNEYYPVRINGLPETNTEFDTLYKVQIDLMYNPKIDYTSLMTNREFQIIKGIKAVGNGYFIFQ